MTKASNSVKHTPLSTHGVNKVSTLRKVRYESSYFPAITIVGKKLNILSKVVTHNIMGVVICSELPCRRASRLFFIGRTCNNIMSA